LTPVVGKKRRNTWAVMGEDSPSGEALATVTLMFV
jgi:hypothetical protein